MRCIPSSPVRRGATRTQRPISDHIIDTAYGVGRTVCGTVRRSLRFFQESRAVSTLRTGSHIRLHGGIINTVVLCAMLCIMVRLWRGSSARLFLPGSVGRGLIMTRNKVWVGFALRMLFMVVQERCIDMLIDFVGRILCTYCTLDCTTWTFEHIPFSSFKVSLCCWLLARYVQYGVFN